MKSKWDSSALGSPSVKTGLCIVAKRADTFSTYPYMNHPEGKFYPDNADIPLWKLIRASSAAPTYFRPIELDIGEPGKPDIGVFIDIASSAIRKAAALSGDVMDERERDITIMSGLLLMMLGIKAVKLLPGFPFAPGVKGLILIPIYLLATRLTRGPMRATLLGCAFGLLSFLL